MNEAEDRERRGARYSSNGDEEIDASMMKVRNALLALPKVTCPAGFEYRLNRRLQGLDGQMRSAARTWTSGWLGVSLGFAFAAVIALFAFDFDAQTPTIIPVTGNTEQAAPSQPADPVMEQVTQTNASGPLTGAQHENLMATTDSVPQNVDPTYVSSDRLRQVSGEEDARGTK